MYLCKFGAEKATGSEERAQKRLNLQFFKDDDFEMRWTWKLGQGVVKFIFWVDWLVLIFVVC